MRWSEAVTLEFVKIYLKYECLWNPSHMNYKLKHEREQAYNEISSEFKASTAKSLSILEVKLKIKNLRTTYAQQVHKILEKSSPDCIYEPSLVWFQEMDRCLKHVSGNRNSTTYSTLIENPEVDSSSQIWVDQQLPSGSTEDIHPDPLVPHMDGEHEVTKSETIVSNSRVKSERESSPIQNRRSKRKKSKRRHSFKDYSTDSNSETLSKDVNTKEDEFDIYGKYIATQLRNMNLQKALRLQLEIQSLVSEARISDIMSD